MNSPKAGAKRQSPLIYVMLGRVLFLALLLITIAMLIHFKGNDPAFYVFMATAFAITILYSFWLRQEELIRYAAPYQFIVDVLLITGLIHFTGGINSELVLLYPLLILVTGIVVSGKMAIQVSVLSIVAYATLITLEFFEVLHYRGMPPFPYADVAEVSQVVMLRILIFALFAAATGYLADTCLLQNRQLQRLRTLATSIIDNVRVPLLVVFETGRIMMVNPAFAEMLQTKKEELAGKDFRELFVNQVPSLTDEESSRFLWQMKKGNGGTVPVTFQATKSNFPASALGLFAESGEGTTLYMVAVREMPSVVNDPESQVDSRKQTAASTVTEMAHIMKNPLTAIRGAGELLNNAVDTIFEQSNQITETDWQTVRDMVELISEQSTELDEKMKYFLNCAANDSEELEELLKNAEEWSKKIIRDDRGNNDDQTPDSR